MLHFSAGTPSKQAPGSVRSQQPPSSLQATTPGSASTQTVFQTDSVDVRISCDDTRVTNLLRMYTGTDIMMSVLSRFQQSKEVNERITAAFVDGDGADPEHRSTQLALAILALEFSVLVRPCEQAVTYNGASSTQVSIHTPCKTYKIHLIWSPNRRVAVGDYHWTRIFRSNMR